MHYRGQRQQHSLDNDLPLLKKRMSEILQMLNLESIVTIKEIEKGISQVEKIYESPLLLGVTIRCAEKRKPQLSEEILALATHWKNFLPRKELDGLSPVEYEKKYPRGEYEHRIMHELMDSYQERIRMKGEIFIKDKTFSFENDFREFQGQFYGLIPSHQPFPAIKSFLSNQAIITEERRRNGHPASTIGNISIAVFAENIMKNMENMVENLEVTYMTAMQELETIRMEQGDESTRRVRAIFKSLVSLEPFMKCTRAATSYYTNIAHIALLCGATKEASTLANKALTIDSQYRPARKIIEQIREPLKK